MNFLNGIQPVEKNNEIKSDCWSMLPEPVEHHLLSEIDNRIEAMNQNYNRFTRRNRLLSAIAIIQTELNEIENEINRL
jgi:hypothetical protein